MENSPDMIIRYDEGGRRSYVNPAFERMMGARFEDSVGKTPEEHWGGADFSIKFSDENARFYYVNEEACRSLGYDRADLMRLTVADADPDWPWSRWPDHWKELKEKGTLNLNGRHRTKNGRVFSVEISANYFQYGERAFNLALARDTTDRGRAAEIKRLVDLTTSISRELIEMVADYDSPEESPSLSGLGFSARQIEIARQLVTGAPSKAIASDLDLTESTVKTHLAAMYRRLGVNGRMEFNKRISDDGIRLE